jgi:serine/threonine protein kinase
VAGPAIVDAIAAGAEPPASTHGAIETVAGALIGTPAYMSPEQARSQPLDERSDIYSLCVLFHELLSLCHYLSDCKSLPALLQGGMETEPAHPTFITNPHQPPAPADLGWFVMRGLKKDPSERYQSVEEMIERLKRRREGVVPVQCPITFLKRTTGGLLRITDSYPKIAITVICLSALGTLALFTFGGIRLVQALL